jgi:hypothetical protein
MKPRPVKWLFLRGLFFLILGLTLWVYIQPSYSKLLVAASQEMLSRLEGRDKTAIRLESNMILYIPLVFSAEKKEVPAGKRDIRDIHYNSVILFALILFSPGLSLGKRAWLLPAGIALLFITQVLTVLVQVKFFYALQLGEYSRVHYSTWDRNIYAFLKQFFELIGRFAFPFAIWIGFTYGETIGYLTEASPKKKPPKKK